MKINLNRLLVVESSRNKYALALIYRLGSFSTALMAPALLARIRLLVAPALVAPYSIVYKNK